LRSSAINRRQIHMFALSLEVIALVS
jgi:hypothetical protein